jgi:hypothetical protein
LAGKYPSLSSYNYVANNPLIYIDPDGRKIILGNVIDRALACKGIKTERIKYLEVAVSRLKQSKTGLKLYNELDAIKQEIIIEVGELPENSKGIVLGTNDPKGNPSELVNRFDGATVTLDPEHIKKNAVEWGREKSKDASAITLAHELGHTKSSKDDLNKYTKEAKVGNENADAKQATPYENAVREELKKKD